MALLNRSLEGKRVKIVTVKGSVYEGRVEDYIFPEDNEPEGIAGINMDECEQAPTGWVGLNETDIKSIEVID